MTSRLGRVPAWVLTIAVSALAGVVLALLNPTWSMAGAMFVLGGVAAIGWKYPEIPLALFLTAGAFKAAFPTPVDMSIAFGLVVAVVAMVKVTRNSEEALRFPLALWLSVGIALLMALGLIGTPTLEYGVDKFLRFAVLGLLTFFGTWIIVRDRSSVRRFMFSLATIGAVLSVQALVVGGSEAAYGRFTTIGSGTIALGRAAALAVLAVVALEANERRYSRWIPVTFGIVGLTALLGSGSRGPAAGIVAAVGTLFVLRMVASGRGKASIVTAVAGVVLLTSLALLFVPSVAVERFERIASADPGESILARGRLLATGIQLVAENPLTGVGTAGFAHNAGDYVYPHNLFVELGAENGLFAAGMAFILILVALHHAVRTVRGGRSLETDWILLLLIVSVVNSMVSSDVNGNRLLFAAISLALLAPGLAEERRHAGVLEPS